MEENGVWLSLKDATQAYGLSENALRVRISRNKVRSKKSNNGKLLVLVPDSVESAITSNNTQKLHVKPKMDYGEKLELELRNQILEKKGEINELKEELASVRKEAKEDAERSKNELLGVLKEIEIYKENKNQQTEDLKYKLGGTEAKYDSIVEKMSQLLDKIGFK